MIFIVPVDRIVPVDLQSTGGLTAGLRPARIAYPQLQPRGLQIPEDTRIANPRGQRGQSKLKPRGLQIPENKGL